MLLAAANISFSIAVYSRDHKNINNIAFSIFSAAIGAWVIGIGGFLASHSADSSLNWARLFYLSPIFIAYFGVIFAQTFPNENKLNHLYIYILSTFFVALIAGLTIYPGIMIRGLSYHQWGREVNLYKPIYLAYSVYVISAFSYTLYLFRRKSKELKGIYSTQVSLLFKGILIAAIFGVLFNLVLPLLGNYRLIEIGPMFTSIIVAVVGYSILRNRMFDIRLIVTRSIAYAVSTIILSAIYGFIIFGLLSNVIFKVSLPIFTQVMLSIATGFASLFFGRIKRVFDKLTISLFYRDSYDPQTFLDDFNKILVSTFELSSLLRKVSETITRNLKPTYCLFGIRESINAPRRVLGTIGSPEFSEEDINFVRRITPHMHRRLIVTDTIEDKYQELRRFLQIKDVSIIARIATSKDSEGVGYLVLGPKKSGNIYSSQDIKILEIVVNELVVAIQNTLHTEEIENFNTTLMEKVKSATKKLRVTNEKLLALDEAKDDFVSMASHQLRTPLTSVKGNLSLVLDGDAGKISGLQRQLLEQAFSSSQRMVYLIADLLNVSRLKTGKFVIERSPVDLALVVEEEVNQLVDTAKSRQLTLAYDKPEGISELMLDDTKTRQVIMNFIDNAIYYTPAGGRIDVVLSETQSSVECRVIDNGIGIPKSEQHHLFTKFYRASNARKARPDGTGLGLFMAKKVIVSEGGAVIFETKEGKGSTFGFSFPKSMLAANQFPDSPAAAKPTVLTT